MRGVRLTFALLLTATAGPPALAQELDAAPPAPASRPADAGGLNQAVNRANAQVDARNAEAKAEYDQALAAYAAARADYEAALARHAAELAAYREASSGWETTLAAPAPTAAPAGPKPAVASAAQPAKFAALPACVGAPEGAGKGACYASPSSSTTFSIPAALRAVMSSETVAASSLVLEPRSTKLDP